MKNIETKYYDFEIPHFVRNDNALMFGKGKEGAGEARTLLPQTANFTCHSERSEESDYEINTM